MVKPQAISTENLVGLEWNLEDFSKIIETIIPNVEYTKEQQLYLILVP